MKKESWADIMPKLLFGGMLLACVLLSVFFLVQGVKAVESDTDAVLNTLVIDPGHGGIDGGAISAEGIKESDINLAIAIRLEKILVFLGQPVRLTRSDDSCKTDFSNYSEHEDLEERTSFINGTPGAILISIHQNDFLTSQPSGSQVLYASTPGSEELGKRCHQNLISSLDPENRRVAEPAPKALYITSHVTCPAVLVECGFMSNNFDVQKLCRGEYQCAIALILSASLLQYLNDTTIL